VFREIGGHGYIGRDESIAPYPGPIGSVVSPGLLGDNFIHLAQASSLCGACKEACPVDIDLPKMLTRVRAGQVNSDPPTVGKGGVGLTRSAKTVLHLYSRVARSQRLFAASQKIAALGSFFLAPRSSWLRLPAATGWGYSKDFPSFAWKPFRERFKLKERQGSEKTDKLVKMTIGTLIELQKSGPIIDRVQQFTREVSALGAQVYDAKHVTKEIVQFLLSRDIREIMLEPGVLDETLLRKAKIAFTHNPDPGLRAGVTKALCGLADTGSILEAEGAGSPLQASLLPEIHIAVLNRSDILPSLADAMPLVRDKDSAVFITGPSRTADIEMTLTIGVHGPGEVHIFLPS
jgi:L-lactate dehydrogenase complex protein LldF